MSIFKQFSTNANKEAAGVKIPFGPNKDGSNPSITIRRAGKSNKQYAKALERETKPFRRQIELGTMDNEVSEKILRKVYAETIVASWEHIQEENGKEIPFSIENVISLFENLPEFYEEVQKQAANVALFRNEELESDSGN